jgi:archaetidylinositol phosphate synthase
VIKAQFGEEIDRLVLRVFPFLRRTRLKPDSLTLMGVALSALAGAAFAAHQEVVGAIIMLFSGFFDMADGVAARQQDLASPAGAFLDSSMDRIADLLVLSGIAVGLARGADAGGVALVCWAVIASVMTSYTRARAEVHLETLDVGVMERAERHVVLILGALTGYLMTALWIVAIGATLTTVQRLVVARRRLKALTEESPGAEAPSKEGLEDAG